MMKTNVTKPLHWHTIVALALALFAFFMSGLVNERVFEGLPHLEDEIAYLYQARVFAGGNITVESPQPTSAYWQPFVIDYEGNRFGKYTPGWSAMLALGVLLNQTWVINAFLAMLTVALVYRIGYEVFSPDVGVFAAFLTAFSPAALLLNGSLMSHTFGLFLATLFIYAYWRLQNSPRPHLWGIIAGIALGSSAATRPLTTLAIGLPFIAWSGVRLLQALLADTVLQSRVKRVWRTLSPLLVLSAFALLFTSSIPVYSYLTVGDPQQNLYELVWDYDRIGFGEGHGRNRHRLEKAINHTRWDLTLTRADLFGWQFEPVNEEMIVHLQTQADDYPGTGYSFMLIPLGLLIGLFAYDKKLLSLRLIWFIAWAIVAYAWVWFPLNLTTDFFGMGTTAEVFGVSPELIGDEGFSWLWMIVTLTWLYVPLLVYSFLSEKQTVTFTWLLFAVAAGIIVVQMLYWIGSQRYSTRYYFEGLTSAALLTALPLAWGVRAIADRLNKTSDEKSKRDPSTASIAWRFIAYGAFLVFCMFTLYNYSTPRIMALYRFNFISPELIEEVQNAAIDDRPILAIINGDATGDNRVRWRSYGALMAVTSPYLDSEIVVVRDFGSSRDTFIATYPNRQIVDVFASGNSAVVAEPPD
ncbi:MAG: hypothetical protein AAFR81_07160 [Chloroflexota bacterium]